MFTAVRGGRDPHGRDAVDGRRRDDRLPERRQPAGADRPQRPVGQGDARRRSPAPAATTSRTARPPGATCPALNLFFWAPKEAVTTLTFTAEAFVSNGKSMVVRALIDNSAILPVGRRLHARQRPPDARLHLRPARPSPRAGTRPRSSGSSRRTAPRRSAIARWRSRPTRASRSRRRHPFIAAPSGPSYVLPVDGIQPLPGMSTPIVIPATGNGEVAVIFSAEVVSTGRRPT